MNQEENREIYKKAEKILSLFTVTVDGLRTYVLENLSSYLKTSIVLRDQMQNELAKLREPDEDPEKGFEDLIEFENYEKLREKITETDSILKIIPYSVLVSLVSEFDYMINKLLRLFSISIPGVAYFQRANITYEDINNCVSVDDIKAFYIDKYLDTLFRKSHDEIFTEIEGKFKVSEIKSFQEYKRILQITEWRNLIVHNDGNINIQFKSNFEKFGIKGKIDECFQNGKLDFEPQKILEIIDCVLSSGLQIFCILVMHYFGKDDIIKSKLATVINNICLNCYTKGKYNVGVSVINFVLETVDLSDNNKNTFKINLAMFYAALSETNKLNDIFDLIDWDNIGPRFKFAKYLILKDYPKAIAILSEIEAVERKYCFQVWPLCRDLTNTEEFKKYYIDTYGEKFKLKIKNWTTTERDYEEYRKRNKG